MGSDQLVVVGISLGVFASMTGTIGKQLLRFSELCKRRGNKYVAKVSLTIGLALNTAVGPIVDMLSYMFAPQSLIAPLGGLDVVWNTLLAPCTLGEKLTPLVIFGVTLIAGGATATSLFGNHDDKEYDLELIEEIFIRRTVAVYLGVLIVWLLFNILVLQKRPDGSPVRGLSLGLTAGSIAGNMFCVKGFIELVQASVRDNDGDIWAHWLPYVLLIGAVTFALSNLYFLTKAMREYEALFMGAVFEGSLIVCAAVSGCVVYKDLENLEWYQISIYFVALFAIVAGICIVAYGCWKPEDTPGVYKILDTVSVYDSVELNGTVVGELSSGTQVHVLEVVTDQEPSGARAKIEQPEGWISLLRSPDGVRIAEKVDEALEDSEVQVESGVQDKQVQLDVTGAKSDRSNASQEPGYRKRAPSGLSINSINSIAKPRTRTGTENSLESNWTEYVSSPSPNSCVMRTACMESALALWSAAGSQSNQRKGTEGTVEAIPEGAIA